MELYRVLRISDVLTYTSKQAIEEFCNGLPGLTDVRRHCTRASKTTYDLVLVFKDHAHALKALDCTGQSDIMLDHTKFEMTTGTSIEESTHFLQNETLSILATQSLKSDEDGLAGLKLAEEKLPLPVCVWCLEETSRDQVLTLCLACPDITCVGCMKNYVGSVLNKGANFPVRCCSKPINPTVFRGLLQQQEYNNYMVSFEEANTKSPFYCPVNTCSAFISTRKLLPVDNKIKCPACNESICFDCRQSSEQGHVCSTAPTAKDEILQKYNYKICPHCRQGLQRLVGCSHVTCSCGTNICVECNSIYKKCTCSSATRGLEVYEMQMAFANTNPFGSSPRTDLDDPAARDWEADEQLDLGDEPEDDSLGINYCKHSFEPFHKGQIPRHWMSATMPDFWDLQGKSEDEWERHVICMFCYNEAKVTTLEGRKRYVNGEEAQKLAYHCRLCHVVCCRKCAEGF